MAITFKNIRSKEVRVATTEPMISAMWASSNLGPNALRGQDFGWRLAPEVVVEMKRIRKDEQILSRIAIKIKKSIDEIRDTDILKYISDKTVAENAPVAQDADYEDEYISEIRAMEQAALQPEKTIQPIDKDDRLLEAIVEAEELGIDVSKYGDNYMVIKGAIGRAKSARAKQSNLEAN